jgi:hypothetical protein
MSRSARFREPPQPVLPLGHGVVQWDTLSAPVRERVITLWIQLLTEHLAHPVHRLPSTSPTLPVPTATQERR